MNDYLDAYADLIRKKGWWIVGIIAALVLIFTINYFTGGKLAIGG